MPRGHVPTSYLRRCTLCLSTETDAALEEDRNMLTGAITVWCADRAACRARHEFRMQEAQIEKRAARNMKRPQPSRTWVIPRRKKTCP